MIVLKGYIEKGLTYTQVIKEKITFVDFSVLDVNKHVKVITEVEGESMAVCRWVSPKRTRSYPYARVYDILSQDSSKKVAIIPLVKDEGISGDRDFLQWDTISLLSLLNVYIIPAYYCDAEEKNGKITNQKFDEDYVKNKLKKLASYRSTALHWNLSEFKEIAQIIQRVKTCYENIAKRLGVRLHSFKGLEKYEEEILKSIDSFIRYSREKASSAQKREVHTRQPKERVEYEKAKIDIVNYLGGVYHFTVDECILKDNVLWLIENKHSQKGILPSKDDVKDGLLKIMLYKSINKLEIDGREISFRIALKLTSGQAEKEKSFGDVILKIKNRKLRKFYEALVEEARLNDFEVLYYGND